MVFVLRRWKTTSSSILFLHPSPMGGPPCRRFMLASATLGRISPKILSTPLQTLILKNSVRNFSDVGLRRPKLRCYASSFAMQEAKTETQPHTKNDSFGVVLHVNGMKCGGCSAAVKRLLLESEEAKQIGVMNASVNLLTKTVVVKLQGK